MILRGILGPSRASQSAPPDLECPRCGWKDHVPVRTIERSRLEGGIPVHRVVGKVYRCANCDEGFCVGPSGSYVPKAVRDAEPQERRPAGEPKPPREPEPQRLRDRDQNWSA